MARIKHIADLQTGLSTEVEFSLAEEVAQDVVEATWAAETPARAAAEVQSNRRTAYQSESDHLHFEEQANEVTAGTWAAKRAEIKARFPK
mgnify:CR=1 FL=1